MDNNYLLELINEAQARGGGMLLNFNDKPAAVVLTVEKYNQLVSGSAEQLVSEGADQLINRSANQQAATSTDNYSATLFDGQTPKSKILVTGGAGYIGAHAVQELLKNGHEVVVLDNLSSGKKTNVPQNAKFVEGDLADVNLLRDLFAQEKFSAVMHFAASIEVEESVREPQKYFENNVTNTIKLLSVMKEYGVNNLIFSSTCAVYGEQEVMPINEGAKVGPVNPYGYSKLIAERVIKYYCQFSGMRAVVFRYFNACGCDFDGSVAATHASHLIAKVLNVAGGKYDTLTVFGEDYETFDGTCIRDYVHVLDIARAHLAALDKISEGEPYRIYNIGTGKGHSVLEIVNKTSEILNKIIPMEKGVRRAGDAPVLIADNSKISKDLNFQLQFSDLDTIINTSWKQYTQNNH